METTTTQPIVRPALGARVQVQFPGSTGFGPNAITGAVVAVDDDSFDVRPDPGTPMLPGEGDGTWSLFDIEQADARVSVVIL